jgi:transcriptional regulator with XRE-family HTH domain
MPVLTANDATLNPRDIRRDLHLSRERMSRILHVSAKTLERWENRNEILDSKSKKNFAKLREISELARTVYTPDGVEAFLTTPMAVFDGCTALELMSLGDYDRVIGALCADYEGLGY